MSRILVVDDEPLVRGFVKRVLTAAGHIVYEADGGKAALSEIEFVSPDLVICDLFMPEGEGIETIRAIRRTAPNVPIVAVTGGGQWGMLHPLEDAAALGATVALAKPLAPAVLLQVLRELLEGKAPGPVCPHRPHDPEGDGRVCPSAETCPRVGSSVSCGARPPRWALKIVSAPEPQGAPGCCHLHEEV